MQTPENISELPYWKLARHGMTLLLNNQQEEADNLFKKHPHNILMSTGHAMCIFMDALMTFEEDKLNAATESLRDIEKRTSANTWFKVRNSRDLDNNSYADHLENQIIRADSQLFLATLTFLQQDISAYFKGGWILRKSWKHYQQAYNEVFTLYKRIVGEAVPENTIMNSTDVVSSSYQVAEDESENKPVEISSEMEIFDKNELLHRSDTSLDDAQEDETIRNGYFPKSSTMQFPPAQSSSSSLQNSHLKKSQSVNGSLARIQESFSFSFLASFNPFGMEGVKNSPIDPDKETITRLMCGVSFGFGLLQLGMSLLPPSILRLSNFLGFQGNRTNGLANLTQAMGGTDMRAPLATLALLWYHTIVRPFYALDGNNVQAGVQVAGKLIETAMQEHADSSIFLFFKGRVERLKSDIPAAIESFKASIANSEHREIKIMSHHEVGWCYLIELNHVNALQTFSYLREQSRWSRGFYVYLCIISAGSNGALHDAGTYPELKAVFDSPFQGSQLDTFIKRRFRVIPKQEEVLFGTHTDFWKLMVYELLYLWNSLPSCSFTNIRTIIKDCETMETHAKLEPFLGLSHLIAGCAHCILKEFDLGVVSFRKCLQLRQVTSSDSQDAHVSAFALYELGLLLIRDPETKSEGKQCLQQVRNYKDYDFEQRLSVRIHSILKHL